MEKFRCVLQYPREELLRLGFPHSRRWNGDVFAATAPIVLELGCGRGEYTVGLAKSDPARNFIGLDIKGARMWTGARQVEEEKITNAAFLRCEIENIAHFFAPGEVAEIWITFPDPQMKKVRKRLTGTRFLELYRKVLAPGGVVNLKTDSPFLYTYTREMARHNGLQLIADTSDLYGEGHHCATEILGIRTYYEQQWLERGLTIKYISFELPGQQALSEPEVEIEHDTYRSFSRGELQHPELREAAVKPKQ